MARVCGADRAAVAGEVRNADERRLVPGHVQPGRWPVGAADHRRRMVPAAAPQGALRMQPAALDRSRLVWPLSVALAGYPHVRRIRDEPAAPRRGGVRARSGHMLLTRARADSPRANLTTVLDVRERVDRDALDELARALVLFWHAFLEEFGGSTGFRRA